MTNQILDFHLVPLAEIHGFLESNNLLFYLHLNGDLYELTWKYILRHPHLLISSIFIQDFILAHQLQGKMIERHSASSILSASDKKLADLSGSLRLTENSRERIIRILGYLKLLDQDMSVFDLLPKDILRFIGLKLDCSSIGFFSRISRRLYDFFGTSADAAGSATRRIPTDELTEMIRIRLHESTRLDLSQFDKDQLSLLCRRENHSSFLSAGENHSLVLDSKGRVFSFGHNDEYQLGFPDKVSREYPALMREIENDPIKAVSAGHRHSLILNSQGWVFSFGNNLSGQLGIEEYQDGSVPALIDLPDKEEIVAIAAGERHSLVLNSQGQVFSFGANELGQLGLGGNEDRFTPTLIEDPELGIVVAIAAGGNHSLLLNSQGQVFSCGAGAGETYDPDRDDDEILFTPYLINTSETGEIIALSTGHNHSLLLNSQGQVFGFGNNEDGQLGIRDYHIGYTPILIETLGTDKIIAISAGGAHSLFLNSEGQVFSCGLNEYRQLGFKDRDNQIIPTLIGTLGIGKIIAISAGKNYSLFSNSRGRVFGSGCNSYGKLGSSDRNFRTTPTLIRGLVI